MAISFSLMLEGQEGVTWPQWLAIAEAAERLGFDALFTSDHYLSDVEVPEPGSHDAWTLLAALATRTERLRLGTMVSPVTYRLPTVLAKAATTVDRISGGRVVLGMGAGWWEEEHRTHGIPFPPTGERFETILSLNFVNPFPHLLGRGAPRHVTIGADPYRSVPPLSEKARAALSATDLVLWPKCPETEANHRIRDIYAAGLEGRRTIALSPCWDGLVRAD